MTKVIILLATTLLSLVVSAQVSEKRTVSDFSNLKVATGVQVSYTISNSKSVLVETDDNEKLQFIKTEVENGVLKIFIDNSDKNYKDSKKRKRSRSNLNYKDSKSHDFWPIIEPFSSKFIWTNKNRKLEYK